MIESITCPETSHFQSPQADGPTARATPPAAPPFTELEHLGERIAELSLQIDAATYHLLVMIREFDQRSGWNTGFRSCAHWMSWRTGTDLGAARERVRVARALAELPLISEALRRGEISYSKVRAITRVANPKNEEELLVFARAGTAAHVERLVRSYRRAERMDALAQEEQRYESRYLQAHVDDDGMVVVRGLLTPEVGAVFLRALEAAGDELFTRSRERGGEAAEAEIDATTAAPSGAGSGARTGVEPNEPSPSQRRADALGLMAESALASGLDPGTRGDRYQVIVHVDAEALPAESEEGQAVLADGQDVPAETSRRLCCDSALVTMVHGPDGSILDVGRRTRAISPALRRALEHRDGGCRFPGCGVKVCDGHHVKHWADGGETKLSNTLLLCSLHHRAVHEGGFRVELLADGEERFYRPDGRRVFETPPLPVLSDHAVVALTARLADQGVAVDPEASLPDWNGGPVDYGWSVEWLLTLR